MLSRSLQDITKATGARVTVAALSYRGYWTSRGRPSQAGIELDAQAFLDWASCSHPQARTIIWGQSLGAGIALRAIANSVAHRSPQSHVRGMILETPFVSLRRMLETLYPQRWLPYRHLWPFLRSTWDAEAALREIVASKVSCPPILLLPAADDEVVPPEEVNHLEAVCKELKLSYVREDVANSFHNDASSKNQGRRCIAKFIANRE